MLTLCLWRCEYCDFSNYPQNKQCQACFKTPKLSRIDQIQFKQQLSFDGFLRLETVNHKLKLPQDVIKLCFLFYKINITSSTINHLQSLVTECIRNQEFFIAYHIAKLLASMYPQNCWNRYKNLASILLRWNPFNKAQAGSQSQRSIICTNYNINASNSPLASTAGIKISAIVTANLPQYKKEMISSNPKERIHGTMCIRILLAKGDTQPPYQKIVDADIVPLLLSFLGHDDNPKLQFEAAWAVTNLCSTDEICNYLYNNNATEALEGLLITTKHSEIIEQAIWGLGNIAGQSQELRNTIIKVWCLFGSFSYYAQKNKKTIYARTESFNFYWNELNNF